MRVTWRASKGWLKMSNLKQVADLAKVSVATASRVLNGSSHPVSGDVRERVRAAATQLSYMPSAAAQALKHKRTRIIGVIASDILDPYFAEMTRGIEIEAAKHGFVTVLANANRDANEERNKFQALREHRASGIIFCGSGIDQAPGSADLMREVNQAIAEGTQVVTLAPRDFDSTAVVIDNEATAYELTCYLLSLGHRRIVFLGGIPGLTAAEQRIVGYRRAMAEHGLPDVVTGVEGMSQGAGKHAMRVLLADGNQPEAVVCSNDEVAIGALAQLWASGIRVPEDVSVAGIGGTQGGDTFELTTMALPLLELGASAARFITEAKAPAQTPATPPYRLRVGRTTQEATAV